jgi:hypothetical protein
LALHARILAIIGLAAVVAAPAAAQTPSSAGLQAMSGQPSPGQASGLRYLNWNGKRPDPARTPPAAAAADRREAPVPPAAIVYGPPVPAERPRNGLTPASAWLPAGGAPAAAAPAAPPAASPPAAYAPPPVITPAAPEGAAAVRPADAPRPDAPIFRLAAAGAAPAPATPVQPQAPAAPQAPIAGESPRFYSVHRAAGRTPDPVVLPAPVMLDQAPVDLAEPEGPPLVLRDARGRLVPAEVLDGSTLP